MSVNCRNDVLLLPYAESQEDVSDAAFEHAVAEVLAEYDETFKELRS